MFAELALASSLFLFLILERFTNAFAILCVHLIVGGEEEDGGVSDMKAYASIQMLGSGASLFTSVYSAVLQSLLSAFQTILSYIVFAGVTTFVFAFLYILQEYYPEVLLNMVEYWNKFVGPFAHSLFLSPLQIFNTVFTAATPALNYGAWLSSQFLYNTVVTGAMHDLQPIRELGVSTANLFNHTFLGVSTYLPTFVVPCPVPADDSCYDPGRRTYDFITPMADVRRMVSSVSKILDNMCGTITGPVDILAYPLLDINTAKAVHNIGNSILYTLIHIPSVTYQRCKNEQGFVMCLPDFEPPLNMMISGLRNLGDMLDNWLDVSSIVIQETLGIDTDTECRELSLSLTPANYSRQVFGTNEVRVVGLTEGLYAVTDGNSVQYFNHYGSTESIVSAGAWPIQVDVSYGIASVTYFEGDPGERDNMGDSSTAMLGCACSDSKGYMEIKCAIVLYESQTYGQSSGGTTTTTTTTSSSTSSSNSVKDGHIFNVVFQKRSTANYMTCQGSEISVQSVRSVSPSDRAIYLG